MDKDIIKSQIHKIDQELRMLAQMLRTLQLKEPSEPHNQRNLAEQTQIIRKERQLMQRRTLLKAKLRNP